MEAKKDRVAQHEFRHDRHTVSLLTDHLVFSPKYRGKVLEGEVAEAAEDIIRETCKELDIEVIDKPFFRKESFTKETVISAKLGIRILPTLLRNYVSGIAKRIKVSSSKTRFKKSVYGKMLRNGARMGGGGEVYLGTEELREKRYYTGCCDR